MHRPRCASAASIAFLLFLALVHVRTGSSHAIPKDKSNAGPGEANGPSYPLLRLMEAIETGASHVTPDALANSTLSLYGRYAKEGMAGRRAVPGEPTDCPTGASRQALETLCDGLDNDCDGVVDLLIPVDANACVVAGAKGRCAQGYYQCTAAGRVCIGGSPAPESYNLVDDNCDGLIDNVPTPTYSTASRLALLVPSYIANDLEVLNSVAVLDQWGVPYDRINGDTPVDTALSQLTSLAVYSVVLIPVRVDPTWFTAARASRLTAFANAGGTVVFVRPAGSALALAGIASAQVNLATVTLFRVEDTAKRTFGIFDKFDAREELEIPVVDKDTFGDLKVYMDVYAPSNGAALITAYSEVSTGGAATALGAVAVSTQAGKGRFYAFGHNMYAYYSYRGGYINAFDPAIDLWGLLLRGFLREATQGHAVVKHTVPGPQSAVIYISHDAEWDEPYVKEMNDAAAPYGGKPNFYVQTPVGTNKQQYRDVAAYISKHGASPLMAHSCEHEADFGTQAVGDCSQPPSKIAQAYKANPRTLCGELIVPKYFLESATGVTVTGFRSPYLLIHRQQYVLLKQLGYVVDSSIAISELKTNLPIATEKINVLQFNFNRQALYTMPLQIEDGLVINNIRTDLQAANLPHFLTVWRYVAARIGQNNGHIMLLDHPGIGLNSNDKNDDAKIEASRRMYQFALGNSMLPQNLASLVTWWSAREAANVKATFTTAGRYEGTISAAANKPIKNFALEFSDNILAFTCACCGASTVTRNRVVVASLAGGTSCSFVATVDMNGSVAPPPPSTPASTSTPKASSTVFASSSRPPFSSATPLVSSTTATVSSATPLVSSTKAAPTTPGPAPTATATAAVPTPTSFPACSAPQSVVLVDNFANAARFAARMNIFGGIFTDDGTMNMQRSTSSYLVLQTKTAASHWTMSIVGAACYAVPAADNALTVGLIAPVGIDFDLRLSYRSAGSESACSGSTLSAVVALSAVANNRLLNGARPATVTFPLSLFGAGVRRNAVYSIQMENFRVNGVAGTNAVVSVDAISFAKC
eukprot:Opistho-2@56837